MLLRTFEINNSLFHDEYAQGGPYYQTGLKILRLFAGEKVYCPFPPNGIVDLQFDELKQAADGDPDVMYVLVGTKVKADEDNVDVLFENDSFEKEIGYKYRNIYLIKTGDIPTLTARTNWVSGLRSNIDTIKRAREERDLMAFITTANTQRMRNITETMRRYKEELEQYKFRVVEKAREVERLTIEKEVADTRAGEMDTMLREYLTELRTYPSLLSVKAKDNKVVFYTDYVKMRDTVADGYRPLGKFVVEVDMESSRVKFTNLDNKARQGNIPHPHCGEDGIPCLGNISTVLPELVASYDLLGMWQIILSFLQSFNKDDSWGRRYKFWPLTDADGNPLQSSATCSACGRDVDPDDELTCCDCGVVLCFDCATDCDGNVYCHDHRGEYCFNCEQYHESGTGFSECRYCGENSCEDSMYWSDEHECYFCNRDCRNSYDNDIMDSYDNDIEEE